MVLVIGDAGQAGVEGHHQQGELQQWAEEAGATPREPGLEIELEEGGEKGVNGDRTLTTCVTENRKCS